MIENQQILIDGLLPPYRADCAGLRFSGGSAAWAESMAVVRRDALESGRMAEERRDANFMSRLFD